MSQAIAVCHGEFGRAALYRLNKTITTHAHREGHLIFYADGSDAQVKCGDVPCNVNSENAVAVSPWEPHSYEIPVNGEQICLVLYIKPMWFLENSVSAENALKFGGSRLKLTPEISGNVNYLITLLLENEEHKNFDQLLFSLTKDSFDRSWEGAKTDCDDQAYSKISDFRVRRSLRLIREKIGEDMDMEMEKLARSVGLSRPHFFKLFKQCMGVTPNVYMNTLRSERAIEDLLKTEKTVTDIAFDLGFSSQASFTRFFSSNVGIAPSEYRRVAHVTDAAFPMM